jgi:hypothetical protein
MAAFGSIRKKDIEEAVLAGKSARERLHEKVRTRCRSFKRQSFDVDSVVSTSYPVLCGKTFRGWANKHLAKSNIHIDDLITVRLVAIRSKGEERDGRERKKTTFSPLFPLFLQIFCI